MDAKKKIKAILGMAENVHIGSFDFEAAARDHRITDTIHFFALAKLLNFPNEDRDSAIEKFITQNDISQWLMQLEERDISPQEIAQDVRLARELNL